jgi:hypothetical protein
LDDPETVAAYIQRWHEIMQDTAQSLPDNCWWLEDKGVGFRLVQRRQNHGIAGADFGTDPSFGTVTIQFNMPTNPGTLDGATQIGVMDTDLATNKGIWLMHQGRLSSPGRETRVTELHFERLTGLPCAFTTPAQGKSPARLWFRVCRLNAPESHIRAQTAEFVRRCSDAREAVAKSAPATSPVGNAERARQLAAELEPTGPFVVPPQEAREVRRIHGIVVNTLAERLSLQGITSRKVWHLAGYEIDLAIDRQTTSLLLEVKTGALAQDIHTGIGQLMLYPELMPELKQHQPVLLLPGAPPAALAEAISAKGVACHWYGWTGAAPGEGSLVLSPEFESLCGLS